MATVYKPVTAPAKHFPSTNWFRLNFILTFTVWIGLVGFKMIDLFEWNHAILARRAPTSLTFTSGVLLITINAIINPIIYFVWKN